MRILTMALIIALAVGCLGAAAHAQPAGSEQQVVIHLDVLQTGQAENAGPDRLPAGYLAKAFKSGEVRLIQSADLALVTGLEGSVRLGRKTPIVYFDPRAKQFQIQYVDTGLKLYAKCRQAADGSLDLDATSELSTVEAMRPLDSPAHAVVFPQAGYFSSRLTLPQVHFGDSVVIARAHGAEARRLIDEISGPAGGPTNLMMVVTVTKP